MSFLLEQSPGRYASTYHYPREKTRMPRPSLRDPNRVPATPITRLIREYIAESTDSERTTGSIIADLAEQVGHDAPTFSTRYIYGSKAHPLNKTMDRDLADRVLCAINCVEAWYTEPELAAA